MQKRTSGRSGLEIPAPGPGRMHRVTVAGHAMTLNKLLAYPSGPNGPRPASHIGRTLSRSRRMMIDHGEFVHFQTLNPAMDGRSQVGHASDRFAQARTVKRRTQQ